MNLKENDDICDLLPIEIIVEIFKNLSFKELIRMESTSKKYKI